MIVNFYLFAREYIVEWAAVDKAERGWNSAILIGQWMTRNDTSNYMLEKAQRRLLLASVNHDHFV